MNGKGSKRRPSLISQAELERRWEQAFVGKDGTKFYVSDSLPGGQESLEDYEALEYTEIGGLLDPDR